MSRLAYFGETCWKTENTLFQIVAGGIENFAAAVEPVRAHMMTQVGLAGSRFDG